MNLDTNLKELNRVGATTASNLKKLGLETISDLLFYFPYRYENFGDKILIKELQANTNAHLVVQINLLQNRRGRSRKINLTEALVSDESGDLKVIWFNQPFIAKNLKVGDEISLAGKVTNYHGQLILNSPTYEKISERELIHTAGLIPIYSLSADTTQKQLRFLIKQALPTAPEIIDWLPNNIKNDLGLLNLPLALERIHFPKTSDDILHAKQRLAFSELFLRQLRAQMIKKELKTEVAPALQYFNEETNKLVKSLPFTLTPDQKKAAWEIIQDLEKATPMSRLLEGDVGSGKTLVAVLALFNVALNGQISALMAPTEILAVQHYLSLTKLLKDFPIKISLLTRSNKQANFSEKPKLDELLSANIIIGTQALIQDKIDLSNIALIIVDEQHRFGVKQRGHLSKQAKTAPHFLSLSATPIPRSLALAIYGNLNISLLKNKPLNRQPIITKIVAENKRTTAYDFVKKEIKNGRQAFVVCPLIDPSDKSGYKSVKEEYERLNQEIFPDIKIGLLHGKLKANDKAKIMEDFANNKISILVSTSVIEVGIDVPNATIMIIEGAQRFGLAQLHQFRGRVGRDEFQSYCLLFTTDNSSGPSQKTQDRLEALVKYNDGFKLAEEDLKLRGAGEIYGTIQSGYPELKIASLFDYDLIKKAATAAEKIISLDPDLDKHPLIKAQLGDFEKDYHLE